MLNKLFRRFNEGIDFSQNLTEILFDEAYKTCMLRGIDAVKKGLRQGKCNVDTDTSSYALSYQKRSGEGATFAVSKFTANSFNS